RVHLVPHALGGVDARAPAGADGDAHPHPPDGPRVVRNRRAIHHRRPEDGGRGGTRNLRCRGGSQGAACLAASPFYAPRPLCPSASARLNVPRSASPAKPSRCSPPPTPFPAAPR